MKECVRPIRCGLNYNFSWENQFPYFNSVKIHTRILHTIKVIFSFFLDMKVTPNSVCFFLSFFFSPMKVNYNNSYTRIITKKGKQKICDAELKIQPLYLLGKSYHGSKNFQRSSTCS